MHSRSHGRSVAGFSTVSIGAVVVGVFELPVVPTVRTGRPLGDVEPLGVSLAVFHPASTDRAREIQEFQVSELVVAILADTPRTVDAVTRVVLEDFRLASRTFHRRWRPSRPPDVTVVRRRCRVHARQSKFVRPIAPLEWCGDPLANPEKLREQNCEPSRHYYNVRVLCA